VRLEGATKDAGADLVSEDTRALLDDSFTLRPSGEINVKGRARPVITYDVVE
jgi:class 3 adenylate cyclase